MAAYARQAVPRTSGGWSVSGNVATLVSNATFPAVATGATTATHFSVGKASSGAGEILFKGTLTPPIVIAPGVTPVVAAGTTITQTTSDGMPDNNAAPDLLKLLLNNTTWAAIGDATGIVGSTAAGSLYLALHTGDPGESGTQSSVEVTYV